MEVIILCGGLGTRLRSVVSEIPKCLAPVSPARAQFGADGCSEPADLPSQAQLGPDSCSSPADLPSRAQFGADWCSEPADLPSRAQFGAYWCSGQPFLGWLLQWLGRYPVRHVVFSVGYLGEQVKSFVESRPWPFSYDFAVESTPLGTGGAIRYALGFCREERVVVLNGDTFYPVDLNALLECGLAIPGQAVAPVTLALKPMKDFDRYGTVAVARASAFPAASENYFSGRCPKNQFPDAIATPPHADAQSSAGHPCHSASIPCHSERSEESLLITAFHEKQPCREGLINGGVYAINRKQLDLSHLPERFSFEKEVLEPLAAEGRLKGWVSDAYFIDIGIPEDYARAQWAIPAWFAVQEASAAVLKAPADTLFLDRDGVLNRLRPNDYVKCWDEWEWLPSVLQELAKWSEKFRHIVLVTNQRGVGKGLMTDGDLSRIHARMMTEVLEAGGRIDLILSCTALNEDDPRRKPNPGMFREAQALYPDIDAKRSVMLGDSPSDAAFAKNCGMAFIRL